MARKSSELIDAMRADADRKPKSDRLEQAKKKVAEMRDLELANVELSEKLQKNGARLKELRDKELVDLFDEIGINTLGVDAEGNKPAFNVEIGSYYHAHISEETVDDVDAAYEWLRKNKHGDLIRATYTVSFGKGESVRQKAFESLMKKNKFEYDYKFGVPWNTLTAFVKEQIEEKKATLPLKLLGATVGRVAKIVKPKKGK